MNRLFLINKECGETSFKTVARVRRKLNIKKAGHAGTLDQFASGLLLILTGRYTRLVEYFTDFDKVYRATFEFGKETETLDPEGHVIAEGKVPTLSEIETALPSFLGKISQKPPHYSAVHVNGERAYRLALKGKEIEIPARQIEIFNWKIVRYEPPFLESEIHCSKGTYIRSLARDLGRACGSCAYVSELQRHSVAAFSIDKALSVDALPENGSSGLRDRELTDAAGFATAVLNESSVTAFYQGKPLSDAFFDKAPATGLFAVLSGEKLAGMVEKTVSGSYRYRLVLVQE